MNTAPRIAIVESDTDLRLSTEELLAAAGHPVWSVGSAKDFYHRFAATPADIVVLDIGLPGEDGFGVVSMLKGNPAVAVVIVSARDTVDDRLAGLRAGADRYLVKPVEPVELRANIAAVARRMRRQSAAPVPSAPVSVARQPVTETAWQLNSEDWSLISPEGRQMVLTAREFALLVCLVKAHGEAVRKQALVDVLFGAHVPNGSERVNVMLARLRSKVIARLGTELPVRTAHHIGYAFTAPAFVLGSGFSPSTS